MGYDISYIDSIKGGFLVLRIPVRKLKEGMIVSQSIFNKRGGSYLVKGQPLSSQYIEQLERLGIPTVTVTSADPSLKIAPPDDVVEEVTRLVAIERMFDTFQSVENTGEFDVQTVQDVSDTIIFDIIQKKNNLVQLTDIRLHDTYTFAHSVNVAILSAMLGLLCHYSKQDLSLLTLGALLHDLGKVSIDTDILTKPKRLTKTEFDIIKNHPLTGSAKIHEMGPRLPSPSILAAIASQHHEHIDGTGYPRGITGNKIHKFAKIVAIADVYDALTSERPYKKAYTPSIAFNIMTNVNKGQFDPELLKLFFDNVALYPVGTVVKTVYGFGVVTECKFGHTRTPKVCIFADKEGRILDDPIRIDLTSDGSRAVEGVVSGIELLHFIHEIHIDPSAYLAE